MSDTISMTYTDGGISSTSGSISGPKLSMMYQSAQTMLTSKVATATNLGKICSFLPDNNIYEISEGNITLDDNVGVFVDLNGRVSVNKKIDKYTGNINNVDFECEPSYLPKKVNGKVRFAVAYYSGNLSYIFVIYDEQDITKVFYDFSNCTTSSSAEPYQPIQQVLTGSVVCKSATFSSNGITINSTTTYTAQADVYNALVNCYDADSYYTNPESTVVLVATTDNGYSSPSSFTISVGSWANHSYRVDTTGGTYHDYFGKEIEYENIFKAYKVVETWSNDYKTMEEVKYSQLSDEIATIRRLQSSGAKTHSSVLRVSFDGFTKNISLNTIGISSIQRVKSVKYGDTYSIPTKDLSNLKVIYADGTYELMSNLTSISISGISSNISNGKEVTTQYANISETMYMYWIAGFSYTMTTTIQENLDAVESVTVKNFVSNWHWGNTMYMNGTLELRDSYGGVMKEIDLSTAETSLYDTDYPIGQVLGETTKSELTAFDCTFHIGDKDLTTTIPITLIYAKSLEIKTMRTEPTQYLDNNEDFSIDNDYQILWFNNGDESYVDVTDVTITKPLINYDITHTYYITFSKTYDGRSLSNTFPITVIPTNVVGIRCVQGEISAYDSGVTEFFPSTLTFVKVYNKPNTTESIDYRNITFYRDEDLSVAITNGQKISYNYGKKIYFKASGMSFVGEIDIDFIHDSITELQRTGGTFILGNRPKKSYFVMKATRKSGNVESKFTDYEFSDMSLVTSSKSIKVMADGKEWTISNVTYASPTKKSLNLNLNGAKTSFQNGSPIDLTMVEVEIEYTNAEPTTVTYDTCVSISTGSSSYKFDGSEGFVADMGGQTTKDIVVTFTANDPLGTSTYTINTTIKIYEISDITGIQIIKSTTEYGVGQQFLNESDETTVRVYYTTEDNTTETQEIKLNSGFPYLNTTITKGTKLAKEGTYTISVTSAMNSSISASYMIYVAPQIEYDDNTDTVYLVAVKKASDGVYYLYEETASNQVTYVDNGKRYLKSDSSADPVGYLKNVGDFNKNGVVVIYKDYVAPNDSDSNMEVKFPCYVSGYADQINKCTFGILFGNNNAKNRLFVSGNPDMPNYDWHTGETNTNGDLTYFSDLSFCAYGQNSNEVVGYDIISDGKLAVFKSKSALEPTIYYRTSTYVQAIDSVGNTLTGIDGNSLYQEEYPLTTGNIGFGAISHKSIANFNGDTLFLSSGKELDGLDVVGEIGNSQRHANTRSQYIDPKIREKDLDKAIVWTDNTTLYLAFDDELYQCDYRSQAEGSEQYEWWRSDIKGIKSMCLIDDVTYFGTEDGRLCVLEGKDYYDNDKIFVSYGGGYLASVDTSDTGIMPNTMYVNSSYMTDLIGKKGCKVRLYGNRNPYAQVATIGNIKGSYDLYITTNSLGDKILKVDANGKVDRVKELDNVLLEDTEYVLNPLQSSVPATISAGNCDFTDLDQVYVLKWDFEGFSLYQKNGSTLTKVQNLDMLYRANLCVKLKGTFPISEIKQMSVGSTPICVFNILDDNGKPFDLVDRGALDNSSVFPFEIIVPKPIEAYYITSPFVMGNLSYSKTVWSWTITDDTAIKHSLRLGTIYSFDKMNDVGDYLMQNSWLKKSETPMKYTFVKPMRCPFVCFVIKNIEGENSVLSTIQIQYSLSSNAYSKF